MEPEELRTANTEELANLRARPNAAPTTTGSNATGGNAAGATAPSAATADPMGAEAAAGETRGGSVHDLGEAAVAAEVEAEARTWTFRPSSACSSNT